MKTETMLQYFGTDFNVAGHYFWDVTDKGLRRNNLYFGSLPFNPEELLKDKYTKGNVEFFSIGGYTICAICGSCFDKRGGTKSVFFVKELVRFDRLRDILLCNPTVKKLIEQMPFEVSL